MALLNCSSEQFKHNNNYLIIKYCVVNTLTVHLSLRFLVAPRWGIPGLLLLLLLQIQTGLACEHVSLIGFQHGHVSHYYLEHDHLLRSRPFEQAHLYLDKHLVPEQVAINFAVTHRCAGLQRHQPSNLFLVVATFVVFVAIAGTNDPKTHLLGVGHDATVFSSIGRLFNLENAGRR